MITLTGKKVSEGIAIGKLSFYKRDIKDVRHIYVKDVEKEILRLQKSKERATFIRFRGSNIRQYLQSS